MRVLVVNAGSSTLKLSVVDGQESCMAETLPMGGAGLDAAELGAFVRSSGHLDAVGHRVVHGGTDFIQAVLIDERVRGALVELTGLAPLHQPRSLDALDAVTAILPDVPAVACFDTSFHATIPPAASTYALPAEWRRRWPLRRFGFHGLSHSYACRRAASLIGQEVGSLRIVTCHLGSGASVSAVDRGISVDTTMGFTPLEGLVMATRCGSLDPGLVLWLQEHAGISPGELGSTLEHRSGLLALAGSPHMEVVVERAARGDPDARLAIGVYVHRLRGSVAAMAAAMGGLDLLVFTGGVGEHSAPIRRLGSEGLSFMGINLDRDLNERATPDAELTASGATARTLVIASREDLEIAVQVRDVMGAAASGGSPSFK